MSTYKVLKSEIMDEFGDQVSLRWITPYKSVKVAYNNGHDQIFFLGGFTKGCIDHPNFQRANDLDEVYVAIAQYCADFGIRKPENYCEMDKKRQDSKQYYIDHKDKIQKQSRLWYLLHKDEIKKARKEGKVYRIKHKEGTSTSKPFAHSRMKDERPEILRKWSYNHREKIIQYWRTNRKRRACVGAASSTIPSQIANICCPATSSH